MARLPTLRRSEWVLGGYFLYVSALALWRTRSLSHPGAFAWLIPAVLLAIARADRGAAHRAWSIVRDWLPAALVLVAYWSIDSAPTPHLDRHFEQILVNWDRVILNDWAMHAGIERLGAFVPFVLETAYLLVYAVPPLVVAEFYLRRERDRLDDFWFPFLVGTLTTYALLPHFPSDGPRILFPGQDVPEAVTVVRRLNVWILDHGDIRSSVFPSGHVSVCFSAALALWLAVPGRRRFGWMLLAGAVVVWITTIYGRYHYAADGLASIAVSFASIALIAPIRALIAWTRRP